MHPKAIKEDHFHLSLFKDTHKNKLCILCTYIYNMKLPNMILFLLFILYS